MKKFFLLIVSGLFFFLSANANCITYESVVSDSSGHYYVFKVKNSCSTSITVYYQLQQSDGKWIDWNVTVPANSEVKAVAGAKSDSSGRVRNVRTTY